MADDAAPWMTELRDKVAVVTGAHEPRGAAVARSLVAAGARVLVIGGDTAALDELAASRGGDQTIPLCCDLGSTEDIRSAAEFVLRVERPVDVLVHCADVRVANGVDGAVADLDEQYLVNLRGPYLLTQALVDPLRAAGGHVVFLDPTPVGSNAADLMQYAMSRAGVSVLAEGLRKELDGVRITMLRLRERSASCSAEFDPEDIADLVMGAIETPRHLELSELTVTLQSQAG